MATTIRKLIMSVVEKAHAERKLINANKLIVQVQSKSDYIVVEILRELREICEEGVIESDDDPGFSDAIINIPR